MRILAFLFLVNSLIALTLFADRPPAPWQGDPDDFWDQTYLFEKNRTYLNESRSITRGNLGSGKLFNSIGTGDDSARGIVVQTNGKVVMAGRITDSSGIATTDDFIVQRYHPDGEVDTLFGTNGSLRIDFGTLSDVAHGIFLQTDAKIIILGKSDIGAVNYSDISLVRLTSNGALDTTFKTNGKVTTAVGLSQDYGRAGVQDSNGRLVIAGYTWTRGTSTYDSAIARYNTDGSLDTTFKTIGKMVYQLSTTDNSFLAIAIQTDGKILGGGNSYNATDFDFGAARFESNGTVDTAFSTSGKKTFALLAADDRAYGIGVDLQSRVILSGSANNGANNDFAVARMNSDGSLDTAFRTSGKTSTAIGGAADIAYGLSLQSDGKPLLGGYSYTGTTNDFALVRYLTNGLLDTSFSTSGKRTDVLGAGDDVAQGIFSGDGEYLVIGGRVHNGSNFDFGFARYETNGALALPGAVDLSFGTNGTLNDAILTSGMLGAEWGGDESAFYVFSSEHVARYRWSGTLDTSFFTSGKVHISAALGHQSIAVQVAIHTDGKVRVGGSRNTDDGSFITSKGALIRFNTNGTLDTTFRTTGELNYLFSTGATGETRSVEFGVGGYLGDLAELTTFTNMNDNGPTEAHLIRLHSNGTFDTSFSTNGDVAYQGWGFLSFSGDSTGKVYAVNYVDTSGVGLAKGLVHLFLSNGAPEPTFATNGALNLANGLLNYWLPYQTDSSGRPFGVDIEIDNGPVFNYGIRRINQDGSFDTSFATTGKWIIPNLSNVNSQSLFVHLSSDGKIKTAWAAALGASNPGFAIFRLDASGTLDNTFGTGGFNYQIFGTDANTNMDQMAMLPGDKNILTGDYTLSAGADQNAVIVRYTSTGSLDTTFGTSGIVIRDFGAVSDEKYSLTKPNGKFCIFGSGPANEVGSCFWP